MTDVRSIRHSSLSNRNRNYNRNKKTTRGSRIETFYESIHDNGIYKKFKQNARSWENACEDYGQGATLLDQTTNFYNQFNPVGQIWKAHRPCREERRLPFLTLQTTFSRISVLDWDKIFETKTLSSTVSWQSFFHSSPTTLLCLNWDVKESWELCVLRGNHWTIFLLG